MLYDGKEHFHSLSIEEIVRILKTSPKGLETGEVRKRQKQYGKNAFQEEEESLFRIFVRQFNSPLIFILFAASLISLVLKELVDFWAIISILLINALVGFWQEVKAATSLQALRQMTETKNKVLRGGSIQLVPSSDLVPGDCLVFHQGEVVTADIRLIESASLMVDEATLTGESVPVVKNHEQILPDSSLPYEWTNMLLTGSTIVRGSGRGIVAKTGKATYLASIRERAQESSPKTPLQVALHHFAKRYVLLVSVILCFVAFVGLAQGRPVLELLYLLLANLVSAVPEGLPLVVTVIMVLGALLLRKKKTLVRDLPSVETLGSTTVIASDKTGTITEGQLIVKETYEKDLAKLKRIGVLCNESQEGMGDPIDIALIDWVDQAEEIRSRYPVKWQYPFDPNLMLMASLHEVEGVHTLYVKGAYETLREKARKQSDIDEFDSIFHAFLKKGYRVLAFAESAFISKDPDQWELKIVGLIGFLDPPKKGVQHAVTTAKKAGIHVIMITGDHPLTAQNIASEVGIWRSGERVLTGKEMENMSDDILLQALEKTAVLARILPEHKYRVVKALQTRREIVAVTGDGVNDIPALKVANIGIAMGDGSEAAKSVSQMILVDNNFSVIVDAIRNARVIAANVRKVIYYLVSTSVLELVFLSLSLFTGLPIPLSAIQILWINLVTDGVMDKTFPFTREEGNVMNHPTQKAEKAFFDYPQMCNMLYFGLTQGLFCYYLYQFLLPKYSFETVSTILFTSLVLPQWANALQAQKEEEPFFYHLHKSLTMNPLIFYAIPLGLLLQSAAIYGAPSLFRSVSLTYEQWLFPVVSFGCAFLAVEMRKWVQFFWRKRSIRH